jgi:hypothetical protein
MSQVCPLAVKQERHIVKQDRPGDAEDNQRQKLQGSNQPADTGTMLVVQQS